MRAITVVAIAAALEASNPVTTLAASGTLYFCDATGINSAHLDGSNLSLIVPMSIDDRAGRVDVDVVGAKLYYSWGGSLGSGLASHDLVGSDHALLSQAASYHLGVAFDRVERKVYWTRGDDLSEQDLIERTPVDSIVVEEVVRQTATRLGGLAIDPMARRVYWTVYESGGVGTGSIQRADLDGQNVMPLITGLDEPHDLALDLVAQKIYWTDLGTAFGAGRIRRANLVDGRNAEDVVIGLSAPLGIDIDSDAGKMYWAHYGAGKVQRADLDGTNLETLLSGLVNPNEVRVICDEPTAVADLSARAIEVTLLQDGRTIRFAVRVPDVAQLVLDLYTVTGRRLTRLVDAYTPAGVYLFSWEGGAPNGVYFYRAGLSSGESKAGKIVLLGHR